MYGHYKYEATEGRFGGVLYTCAEVFEDVKRAHESYGSSVMFVFGGKQKVRVHSPHLPARCSLPPSFSRRWK